MGLEAPQFRKLVATRPHARRGYFHLWPQKRVQIAVIKKGACDESTKGLGASWTRPSRRDRASSSATEARCRAVPSGIPRVGDRTESPLPNLDKLRALGAAAPGQFYFGVGLRLFPNLISPSVRCRSDFEFLLVSEQS